MPDDGPNDSGFVNVETGEKANGYGIMRSVVTGSAEIVEQTEDGQVLLVETEDGTRYRNLDYELTNTE